MWKRQWSTGGVLGVVLLLAVVPAVAEQEDAVFEMQEVCVFEQGESGPLQLMALARTGQSVSCSFVRQEEVENYPELTSNRPVYGSVTFGQVPTDPNTGVRFCFVIDESPSGETETNETETGETETARSENLPSSLALALTDTLDASGTKRKYDRLYFDVNGDLDLTNDPVVGLMKDSPSGLAASSREVVFDYLDVRFDHGPELGTRPLKVLPRLTLSGSARAQMTFTAVSARKGEVTLAGEEYTALLAQTGMITGRFDTPNTALVLAPADPSRNLFRAPSGVQPLAVLRWFKGEYLQISATPAGDQLTIGPYRGETGVLKVDPGNRQNVERLGVSGVLRSEEGSGLAMGDASFLFPEEKWPEHKIPVGDYAPMSLSVDFGKLTINFYRNRYSRDEPHVQMSKTPPSTVKIRKDQPLVLDFSNKPEVLFTSPARGQTFTPGSSIRIRAAIVDPGLDLIVRGLDDTTQKIGERTYRLPGHQSVTIPRYASLAPTVTITDSLGKQVAQGTMPFG